MNGRLFRRSEALQSAAGDGGATRHATATATCRPAMDRLRSVMRQATAAPFVAPPLRAELPAATDGLDVSRRPPIFRNTPYRQADFPAALPGIGPQIVPAYRLSRLPPATGNQ